MHPTHNLNNNTSRYATNISNNLQVSEVNKRVNTPNKKTPTFSLKSINSKKTDNTFLVTNYNVIKETKLSKKQPQSINNYTISQQNGNASSGLQKSDTSSIFLQNKAKNLFKRITAAFAISKFNKLEYNYSAVILPLINSKKNYCFFKIASKAIQSLIVDISITNPQKIIILNKLYNLLKESNLLDIQKKIAQYFIASVINCLNLSVTLNNLAIWNDITKTDESTVTCYYNKATIPLLSPDKNNIALSQLFLYPLSIDLLCIEEELRFIHEQDNRIDLGIHALDNEWLYMERCYRGFLYLLDTQITSKQQVSFAHLINVNIILGSYAVPNNNEIYSYYGVSLKKDQVNDFIYLVKQGIIYDEQLQNHSNSINDDEKLIQLEKKLSLFFGVRIKLNKFTIDDKLYFTIKIKQPNTITVTDPDQQLLNDLEGKTNNKAFLFIILNNSSKNNLSIKIKYCYDKKPAELCQQLLDIYYHKIQHQAENTKEKVVLAIWLCSLLQRIHPFADANGRTLFFILLPILLYQMDMWLTRMIRYPWDLLDFYPPKKLATKIIDLCFPAPVFAHNIDWDHYIDINEAIRIHTGLGDIKFIRKLINHQPNIINHNIFLTPVRNTITLLEFTIINNQTQMFDFLFNKLLYRKKLIKFDTLTNLLYHSYTYDAKEITAILTLYTENTFNILIDSMEQLECYITKS